MVFDVKEHRNIFIDSRAGTQNNHKSQIHLPTQSFNCQGDELMRITLNSFSMRRNFYKINETNNTFYGVDVANSWTRFPRIHICTQPRVVPTAFSSPVARRTQLYI